MRLKILMVLYLTTGMACTKSINDPLPFTSIALLCETPCDPANEGRIHY